MAGCTGGCGAFERVFMAGGQVHLPARLRQAQAARLWREEVPHGLPDGRGCVRNIWS